jgi:AraC-like DNA-binding protein
MKAIDTTDPKLLPQAKSLLGEAADGRFLLMAGKFRMHLMGMYFQHVGAEWDSGGRSEGDYLHHMDVSLSGNRQVVRGEKVYEMKSGEAWFLPGNTPVERRCAEECDVIFFKFHCEWLPGVDPLLDWPGREPRLIGSIDPAKWRRWLEPGRRIGMAEQLELRACLLSWMSKAVPELEEVVSRHLATHTQFSKIFQCIERNLGADLRLAKLAEIHGTSQGAFSNAFTRGTGISPKDYITRRLNQEALQWVMNSELRIKEIAEKLRFGDEFYFSRFFQKLNGKSPSRYRKDFRDSCGK